MSLTEIFLRVVGKIPLLRNLFNYIIRACISNHYLFHRLNKFYLRLGPAAKNIIWTYYAKLYRQKKSPRINRDWVVSFGGQFIKIPLHSNSLWLDWDLAVSITGHDLEIKSIYEELISKSRKKLVFFDIGANYATHSLLFTKLGMEAIAFEPNPVCLDYAKRLFLVNNCILNAENIAISDISGQVKLNYDETDTWNGTVERFSGDESEKKSSLVEIEVKAVLLDEYVQLINKEPDIIKIDTEGHELYVIQGAVKLLSRKKPLLIFESNSIGDRGKIFDLLESLGYFIVPAVFGFTNTKKFTLSEFCESSYENYLAFNP